MKADPVRSLALHILNRAPQGHGLDALLEIHLRDLDDPQHKSFLAELVRGTLQWRGRYDHVLSGFVRKKLPDDPRMLNLLRMSVHQLIALDSVPPYAAVHQAGELCRKTISPRLVGFVNGLLQNVSRFLQAGSESKADRADAARRLDRLRTLFVPLESDPAAWIAAWHSHPLWLVRRWMAQYGEPCTGQICEWNNRPVLPAFHVLEPFDPAEAAEFLTGKGCPVVEGANPRTLMVTQRPAQNLLTEILEQRPDLIVQDPVVQEATGWLIASVESNDARPHACLDFCAAPGGKTARLVASLDDRWSIVAMDNRSRRVAKLVSTLERTGKSRVDVVQADGLRPPFADGNFDVILMDGPCSGTGVLRHHPDGRWRLNEGVLARNGALLFDLASRAADLLAPGGLLLYATCSLEPEENEVVLDSLLAARPDLEAVSESEWHRQWLPHDAAGDGFFAARIRKKTGSIEDV